MIHDKESFESIAFSVTNRVHVLKLHVKYWDDVFSLSKNFEVRKDDRDFKVGDYVEFLKVDEDHIYNQDFRKFVITYILKHKDFPLGIKEGYCVFRIDRVYK